MPMGNKQEIKNLLTDGLMREVAEGNEDAFATLYRATQNPVYCLLLSIVKNPAIAEDLMQDTYLSVRKSIQNYNPQGKPMAWIFTIAKNLAYMELRRLQRQDADDFSDHENLMGDDDISRAIDNLMLRKALLLLEETDRQIVLLHVVTGLKFVEISSSTQIPLGTVLSRYHRAIRKLQKSVEREAF